MGQSFRIAISRFGNQCVFSSMSAVTKKLQMLFIKAEEVNDLFR